MRPSPSAASWRRRSALSAWTSATLPLGTGLLSRETTVACTPPRLAMRSRRTGGGGVAGVKRGSSRPTALPLPGGGGTTGRPKSAGGPSGAVVGGGTTTGGGVTATTGATTRGGGAQQGQKMRRHSRRTGPTRSQGPGQQAAGAYSEALALRQVRQTGSALTSAARAVGPVKASASAPARRAVRV